ncbi:MAG: 8-amino-7-oxononanoate synthase [Halobacteriovoraceae bacterium]|nr:8-amino-7-oxononanoate synthase [Halobacteriovoraceae bacterium]
MKKRFEMSIPRFEEKLKKRQEEGILRQLPSSCTGIDFASNDYLGYARSEELRERILQKIKYAPIGSTGSRLLTGNSPLAEQLECELADFFGGESALLFNSGYDLNCGLISTLVEKEDTVIMDGNVHASLKQGAKLAGAKRFFFRHNDISHLQKRLEQSRGITFVVVESIYSMDGDSAPLSRIIDLCEKHNARLIIDEAHAVGVAGIEGKGLAADPQWQKNIFARIITFGKALGVQGAAFIGNKTLKKYLINFCNNFIYTTAPSYPTLFSIGEAVKLLKEGHNRDKLHANINFFNRKMNISGHRAPVYSFIMDKKYLKKTGNSLKRQGLLVNPIFSPTVQQGTERLRVCLHAFNTKEEISFLAQKLKEVL